MSLNRTAVSTSSDGEVGLSGAVRSEWEGAPRSDELPIDLLRPNSDEHALVLNYLNERLWRSEREMSSFYSRWRMNEARLQAYAILPNKREREFKEMNDAGLIPTAHEIVIPYIAATVATIVTYLSNVFMGRKPYFDVSSYKAETVNAARMMETVLQYQADHSRAGNQLIKFLQDGETYGVGILRVLWKQETSLRTKMKPNPAAAVGVMTPIRTRAMVTTYMGNSVESIDPFCFFPDPSVPMAEVNKKGEFVIVRSYQGLHALKRAQANDELKWVDDVPKSSSTRGTEGLSLRSARASGEGHAGYYSGGTASKYTYKINEGSFEIIPAELGLGSSTTPEKWYFVWANDSQILAAAPLDLDHGMHPFVISEPYSQGYGFGNMGIVDYLAPIQDCASWFVNSHMQNVRDMIDNALVYNPQFVEGSDLRQRGRSLLIRLKPAAVGMEIDKVLKQLTMYDVTRSHIQDLRMFLDIGDTLAAVNENLRGQPQQGGRKTATEVMTAVESGTARLSHHARYISSMAMVDLVAQMSINTQQLLDDEFYLQVVGMEGASNPIRVSPDQLAGDFYFPSSDGTLPSNKPVLFDIWQQMLSMAVQDQELRQQYDVGRIFEHVAEIGGAKNVESFRRQAMVPAGGGMQGGPGQPQPQQGPPVAVPNGNPEGIF